MRGAAAPRPGSGADEPAAALAGLWRFEPVNGHVDHTIRAVGAFCLLGWNQRFSNTRFVCVWGGLRTCTEGKQGGARAASLSSAAVESCPSGFPYPIARTGVEGSVKCVGIEGLGFRYCLSVCGSMYAMKGFERTGQLD